MKLYETRFTYADHYGTTSNGSYLGRGPASRETIRRFVRGNMKSCGLAGRSKVLTITHIGASRYIAK